MVDDEKNFVTCSWSDSAADGWLPRPGAFGRGCGLGFDVHFGLDTLTLLRTLVLLSRSRWLVIRVVYLLLHLVLMVSY